MTALWRRRCRKLSRFCPSDDALRFPSLFWHHLHCDHDLRHNRMLGFRGSRWSRHGHAHRVNRASNRNGMAAQRVPRQRAERQSLWRAGQFGGDPSCRTTCGGLRHRSGPPGRAPAASRPSNPGRPVAGHSHEQGSDGNRRLSHRQAAPRKAECLPSVRLRHRDLRPPGTARGSWLLCVRWIRPYVAIAAVRHDDMPSRAGCSGARGQGVGHSGVLTKYYARKLCECRGVSQGDRISE